MVSTRQRLPLHPPPSRRQADGGRSAGDAGPLCPPVCRPHEGEGGLAPLPSTAQHGGTAAARRGFGALPCTAQRGGMAAARRGVLEPWARRAGAVRSMGNRKSGKAFGCERILVRVLRLPLPPLLQTVARLEGHASGAAVLSPADLEDLVAQLDSSMAGTAAYIRRGLGVEWLGMCPGLRTAGLLTATCSFGGLAG